MTHRADTDGLPTIAVVSAALHLANLAGSSGGNAVVDICLVISGFLITTSIHREPSQRPFSILLFNKRRATEIPVRWPVSPASTPPKVTLRQAVSSAILARVEAKTGSVYIPMARPICMGGCVPFTETQIYSAHDDHFSLQGTMLKSLPLFDQGLAGILGDPDGKGQ